MVGRKSENGPRLAALLLAAGAGRRFGGPKQLAELHGEPLLLRALSQANAVAGAGTWVVLGARAAELAPLLAARDARVLVNPAWTEGIGASIRHGVAELGGQADAVLILLADQPAVGSDDLQRLVAAWRAAPERPAAAGLAGRPVVPAIFPASWFPALSRLRGDRGARGLLREAQALSLVPMPAAGVDIDRPEDLKKIVDSAPLSGGESQA
ncbi:MAG: nucleotidyltransferase family protein [Gammaproteobacteria bacterium]|nr:MAG: nucleotidyltransferase family protein [Gammaproteobacteria bacterium]